MKHFDLNELEALLCGYWLSDLANFSAFAFENLPDLNWVGFYLSDGKKLRLGPFMGRPACLEIPFGKGVCGEALSKNSSLLVDDVDEFPGHIRCDSRSQSEMVIPLRMGEKILGVLDLDSPSKSRFKEEDRILLEKALQILSSKISGNNEAEFGILLRR